MRPLLSLLITGVFSTTLFAATELRLDVSGVGETGIVITSLDLTPIANFFETEPGAYGEFTAICDGREIETQFIPDNTRGTLLMQFPAELAAKSQTQPLQVELKLKSSKKDVPQLSGKIVSETPVYRITQDVSQQAGLPSRIEFLKTGRVLDTHRWMDRLFHENGKSYDAVGSQLILLADGPLCRVVRNTIEFKHGNESLDSQAQAVYTWYFFKDKPGLIYVSARYTQNVPDIWKEKHFLELHVADGSFGKWCDLKSPDKLMEFTGSKQSNVCPEGAAICDGVNRIAFRAEPVIVYDGLRDFGPYMLGNGNRAWEGWNTTETNESAWISIAAGEDDAVIPPPDRSAVRLTIPELDSTAKTWLDVAKNSLFYGGILKTKAELNSFSLSEVRFVAMRSENLGMLFERVVNETEQGIRLVALVDIPSLTLLTPPGGQAFFSVKVRDEKTKETYTLTPDKGWKTATASFWPKSPEGQETCENLEKHEGIRCFILEFQGSKIVSGQNGIKLRFLVQTLRNALSSAESSFYRSAVYMRLYRYELPEGLSIESITVPQIELCSFGEQMKGFYPQASGIVVDNPCKKSLNWRGRYPSGWCSMPWFAVWDDAKRRGVYFSTQQHHSAVKEMRFQTNPQKETVAVSLEYPTVIDKSRETDIKYIATAYLDSFQGDWYDASQLYRNCIEKTGPYYTATGSPPKHAEVEHRKTTPPWMKDLSVWAQCGDTPDKMPETMRRFRDALGVPVGLHWYNWHEIPFDNDYPHYFPAKPGFAEAVAEIQKDGDMFVMPYINGRLWDTRDKGLDDFEFTSVAKPGVTKKEDGSPYTETYGSKESDGSPVTLGVMCPASKVWRNKVKEIIFKLTKEYGVKSVYVDQVAAAQPELCMDPTHGHPLGGGDWWVKAYRRMFREIRAELPSDAMLTTECNADPFIDIFDGYLTWHFQYDGQVPAFSAVYGGPAILQFGRHFGGGPDSVVACRMKLAESFVFGEQLGWINPHIVDEPEKIGYLKKVVTLRHKFRDLFYEGRMGRPPKLTGTKEPMPRITADWNFMGPTITTTDAVRAGLWYNADASKKRAMLLFANCSTEEVRCDLDAELNEIGFDTYAVSRHDADGKETPLDGLPNSFVVPPLEVFVLELKPLSPENRP